jgi:hypothetical protein
MPALGPVSVSKRTAETIVRLVGQILGDLTRAEGAAGRLPLDEAVTRRMRELGARTERGEHGAGFVARVIIGNGWLLLPIALLHYDTSGGLTFTSLYTLDTGSGDRVTGKSCTCPPSVTPGQTRT